MLSNIDLDLANYDLDDLLGLFGLPATFGEEELRRAKRRAMETHPDKSGLPTEVFRFFHRAYTTLSEIHRIRSKAGTRHDGDVGAPNPDEAHIAARLTSDERFLEKFNALFDKYVPRSHEQGGHGEWLQAEASPAANCSSRHQMNAAIDDRKTQLRALTRVTGVSAVNFHDGDDIDGVASGGFQSALFSSLPYDDLRRAHEESVVPVTAADAADRPRTLHEMQTARSKADEPLSKSEARAALEHQEEHEQTLGTRRAHRLVRQMEEGAQATRAWQGAMRRLTDTAT